MDRAQGAAGDAKIKESLPLEEFCLVVKEVNNEGTHAPYIGNSPAGLDMHGPGDPEQGWGPEQDREMAGQSSRRCCLSAVLQNEFTRQTRKSQAEGTAFQRHGALLRLQGAEYGRSTGHVWGRAGGAQGGQGQLVKSLTRHSRRGGTLSCRPQGVPEGFVE